MGRAHETDPDAKSLPLNRENLAIFRQLLAYLQPHRRRMIISIIALIGSTALGLVLPLVVRNLVDVVLIDKNLVALNRLAVLLLFVFLLQAVLSFIHRLTLAYVGERVVADLRIQLYSHLQKLSLQFYADRRTGEIVSRLTNDVSAECGARLPGTPTGRELRQAAGQGGTGADRGGGVTEATHAALPPDSPRPGGVRSRPVRRRAGGRGRSARSRQSVDSRRGGAGRRGV
jgi:hypothetical protein